MTKRISRRNALTGAAILGVAVPTLAACSSDDDPSTATEPTPSTPKSSSTGSSSAAPSGFADTSDVPVGGGAIYPDDGVVVTQPTEGTFKGFSNVCTHQGCPMRDVTDTINCSCHGSEFSIEDGTNLVGPLGSEGGSINPLPEVPLTVQGTQISMA